jgi:tetratricopeptide (TPR) repeat protein
MTCERCAQRSVFRLVRREIVLLILLSIVGVFVYIGTRALASSNSALKERVAATWFEKGVQDLERGHPREAVAAFQKSVGNDHTNRVYLLSLARALEAAQRDNEARELLLQVRESVPENPETNLELARISARQKNVSDALRYYHNALYSIWTSEDADRQRQEIRKELIDFLISQNAKQQALAETIALGAHLPDTSAARVQLGDRFLRVDDPTDAFQSYKWVLHRDTRNKAALRGAGEAAFKMGNYREAKRLLGALGEQDAEAKRMFEISKWVMEGDPLEPHLAEAERVRRVSRDIEITIQGAESCVNRMGPGSAAQQMQGLLDKLVAQKRALFSARQRPVPDIVFSSLDLIYDTENAMDRSCGPLSVQDAALLLVGQKSRGMDQ